jgi:hypothetical protein
MGRILGPLLLLGLLASPAQAKIYALSASICKADTLCKKCAETVNLSFGVDLKNDVVVASGRSSEGERFEQNLNDCVIESNDQWRCRGIRGELSASDGRIYYNPASKTFLVDDQIFEICIN